MGYFQELAKTPESIARRVATEKARRAKFAIKVFGTKDELVSEHAKAHSITIEISTSYIRTSDGQWTILKNPKSAFSAAWGTAKMTEQERESRASPYRLTDAEKKFHRV